MGADKITQCMKPHGEEGVETIKNMNENHKPISEFAFECIDVGIDDKILDIGCGGGVNIEKFLKLSTNNVDGLDYSEVSVNESIKRNLDIMQDISMHVSVELGKAKSTIKEVIDIKRGSIIELTKIAGEQVEVYINDKYVAKGEVIVIEDKFGIRVTNTNVQQKI